MDGSRPPAPADPDIRHEPATGRPWLRREDEKLLRGAGRFVSDVTSEGCLNLVFVRSDRAGVEIEAIDTQFAAAATGVVLVLTARDLEGIGTGEVNPLTPELSPRSFEVLAHDVVGAVGQPVAAVIATTRAAALDAAELVIVTSRDAGPARAQAGFRQVWRTGSAVGPATASVRIQHARLAPSPLEPRAAMADWQAGRLTAYIATQTPHRARADLARILGLPADCVRVVTPDVGGSFGGKASIFPEDVCVAWAARALGAPVAWRGSRSEDMLAGTHGRGLAVAAELALDTAGFMTGLRAEIDGSLGHWMPFSAVVPGRNAGRILPGPYRVGAVDIEVRGVTDDKAAVGIYRGAGRPEAAMVMERLIDLAARRRGEDPVAFRLRNLLPADALPLDTPTGMHLDRGDYPGLLRQAACLADYEGHRRTQASRSASGDIMGLGVAMFLEPCGEGWESASLRLLRDGSFLASTGTSAQGQGRETAFAQILADALGVSPEAIVVMHGDTDCTPTGIGALASRSTGIGGGALIRAAEAMRRRAAPIADGLWGPGALVEGVMWHGVAEAADDELSVDVRFTAPCEAWSSGCCIARVSIDRDTGVLTVEQITMVDDAGTVINPLLLEGQLLGGAAQGIGEALMERMVYDESCQLLTGSLMDYALPRAGDMPVVRMESRPTISTASPTGARGVGEAGCIGVPAAIVNAAVDALAPFGVTHLDMPLTSEKLWLALQASRTREGEYEVCAS